jgi:hypothetical protein
VRGSERDRLLLSLAHRLASYSVAASWRTALCSLCRERQSIGPSL